MNPRYSLVALLPLVLLCLTSTAQQKPIDLNARTDYQRAIAEVYWQHRIWPKENPGAKPSLDQVISTEQLRQQSEDSLRLSNALAKYAF